ncbi:hypothetical protein ACTI_55410 [Actinoplanes sp. OR16]|uniref:hypothetical protein n=1 Tax=Actinoplanes sp. OR16 TaxID=946334 RepID=UPI000F703C77|nr:hypothetical protein [Actinoplanes sp. OR16]BBH68856.1 hypothetical protein ACTI_55410 [Actinoplanes sp. OR16]
MQRIEITDDGVSVTWVVEPLVSVWGKEMRPGTTDVFDLPWQDVVSVSVTVTETPPDGDRWVALVVDVVNGEYLEVPADAEGFERAVRDLCRLAGHAVPDYARSSVAVAQIWSR